MGFRVSGGKLLQLPENYDPKFPSSLHRAQKARQWFSLRKMMLQRRGRNLAGWHFGRSHGQGDEHTAKASTQDAVQGPE